MKLITTISLVSTIFIIQGCSTFKSNEESKFEVAVKKYEQQAARKALAVSFGSKGWVYGFGYHFPTQNLADDRALAECESRRADRKLETQCSIYMRGNIKVAQ
ncbi:MAG: hypothetical protein ACI89S_002386 [Gammaproteobacteria bacterium]|jgi:hypothetical protein